VEDRDGDSARGATNAAAVAIEGGADERDKVEKGAAELQGDGKKRSNGPPATRGLRGEKRWIPARRVGLFALALR
jgi:hypothetical protein